MKLTQSKEGEVRDEEDEANRDCQYNYLICYAELVRSVEVLVDFK